MNSYLAYCVRGFIINFTSSYELERLVHTWPSINYGQHNVQFFFNYSTAYTRISNSRNLFNFRWLSILQRSAKLCRIYQHMPLVSPTHHRLIRNKSWRHGTQKMKERNYSYCTQGHTYENSQWADLQSGNAADFVRWNTYRHADDPAHDRPQSVL